MCVCFFFVQNQLGECGWCGGVGGGGVSVRVCSCCLFVLFSFECVCVMVEGKPRRFL